MAGDFRGAAARTARLLRDLTPPEWTHNHRQNATGAFAESKRLYVDRLKAGKIEKPTGVDKVHKQVMDVTGEPLPYGIASNRRVIEELIGHATKQGIVNKPVTIDDLFVPSTRGLAG